MDKKRYTISLPDNTKQKLKEIAEEDMRSESNMIAYLIETYYKKHKKQ